jgi:Putative zinc-finger
MRCRDAKLWLTAQRDNDLAQSETSTLQEHLKQCAACHRYEKRQQRLDILLRTAPFRLYSSISTERIMRAVELQKHITQQLEDLRVQQQARIARLRILNPRFVALASIIIGLLLLFLVALLIFQTDLLIKALALLSGGIDALVVLGQYLQTGLSLIIHDNWLLSGMALILVIMMGLWLRLMRHPQEA